MKKSPRWQAIIGLFTISAAVALSGCKSTEVTDPALADLDEKPRTHEVSVKENPNKNLPMDFATASEMARENGTFPGAVRVAADAIEIGRAGSGTIPNIGAQGEAYLEMPHPDGTPLHVRGNRIRSHNGTVTVSGWPVVVRQGKRLVGTTKDTVIKIGSNGVQALGPATVEDLVSMPGSLALDSDSVTPLPSLTSSTPFIPLPPEPAPPSTTVASGSSQKRGIINGKPVGRSTQKRGFTGTYEGTDNPKVPGDPSLRIDIDKSPAEVSTDFGTGNLPPLPTIPNP